MRFIYLQMALLALCIVIVAALMWFSHPWYHWGWFIICGAFIMDMKIEWTK